MVELDPESRKYTTMALDIGRFQWTRPPMGSVAAQDVFQRKLDAIFLDVPGVTGIADYMIIYGRTDLEHDRHLVNFLDICRRNTLMLNPDKMQFRLPQVSFFGHQWSAKGLSPDPKKIAAVKRMDLPRDVDTMRSFLGLVNYLNRFSPRLAELSEPLREICRQDTEFKLTKSVQVAFSKTKEEISKNVTLPYFNSKSDTTLQNRCFQERTWSSDLTKLQTSHVCIESLDWSREELPKFGEGMLSNDPGNGEISLLSLWQTVYT